MLSLINQIGGERLGVLSTVNFLAIDALYHQKNLSASMRSRLKRLVELGIVEHVGRRMYVLARGLYEIAGKSGVHTRMVGLVKLLFRQRYQGELLQSFCTSCPKEISLVMAAESTKK